MRFRYFWVICCVLLFNQLEAQVNQTVGLFQYDSTAYNGYTLFTPSNTTKTYLIDNCGELVHLWTSEHDPGLSVYLLENGNLLRTARIDGAFSGGGSGGRLQLFDWDSALLWQYDYADFGHHQHHDIRPLPNGNILVLAWEKHSQQEAIQLGMALEVSSADGIWVTQLVEIKPILETNDAEIVWKWSLWDHFVQDRNPALPNFGEVAKHPERVSINSGPPEATDWVHANGIDYNEELDQIIINSRNFGEFWIIDHSTTTEEAASSTGGKSGKGGDLLYRWGNPQKYDRGEESDQHFFGQHNANWIDKGFPDEGKVIVFNNGIGRPDGIFSTVDIVEPTLNDDGIYNIDSILPFGPLELSWQYKADPPEPFYSSRISGTTRLPNGNTLICEGNDGRFFEVNNEKEIVWEYINPIRNDFPTIQGNTANQNDVFRATRYALDYPAFEDKDLTPQGVLELESIEYFCTSGLGLIDTLVNTNAITPLLKDIYVVNNPVQDQLIIQNETTDAYWVQISDLTGKRVYSRQTTNSILEINTQNWQEGMYFVQFQNKDFTKFATQKIIKTN